MGRVEGLDAEAAAMRKPRLLTQRMRGRKPNETKNLAQFV
jgi:hypothetical protein